MTTTLPVAGYTTCHRLVSLAQLDALSSDARQHLLGGAIIGARARKLAENVRTVPLQCLATPLLTAGQTEYCELWFGTSSTHIGTADDIRYGCDEQLLYGVVEFNEADFSEKKTGGDVTAPLQQATDDAYRRIFALLDHLGYPYLWRIWNYLANINEEEAGLERYRQFNIGRHRAFNACGRLTAGNVPAACALGLSGGPLSIAFLAGRSAPMALENPRQIPAYDYPPTYGPRSPTCARAALAHLPGQELLLVSGTASILGHATVHAGDVIAQTRETLDNLAAIVEEANRRSTSTLPAWHLSDLNYRAYIRHAADFDIVHALLGQTLGENAPIAFVQADICRAELLVEVEAFGARATQ